MIFVKKLAKAFNLLHDRKHKKQTGVISMKKGFLILILLAYLPSICFAEAIETAITPKAPTPTAAEPTIPAPIDCQYKLPQGTSTVDQPLLSTWAENAAVQSFQFNSDSLKTDLEALKNCYTDQGWTGFNEALKTSGNLEAIKNNKLTVTSRVDGTATIQNIKEKQWKASVPLKVVYKNKEKQLLQTLNVSLLIALNKSGSLGIMQVIAEPEKNADKQT
ncbi:MAG: DotI/IcmL family type IV secretion protein [Legionella sp.]|nr:DotI/IcmL family type IV secretion protein [Legionella sp.]